MDSIEKNKPARIWTLVATTIVAGLTSMSCADLSIKGSDGPTNPDQSTTPITVGGPVNLPASGSQAEVTAQLIDMNDDGIVDGIDLNGDGICELKFIATDDEELAGLDLDGDGIIDYYISFATDPVSLLDNAFLNTETYTLVVDDQGVIIGIDFNGDGYPEDTGLEQIHNDGSAPFLSSSGLPGVFSEAIDVDFFCVDDYACHHITYSITGPDDSVESVHLNLNEPIQLGEGSPGVYTLYYRAVDYAGNEGPLYTLAITIIGAGFTVSPSSTQTDEAGASVDIDVTLDFAPSAAVTIPIQITKPGEATASASSLVLDESNLTGTVTITGQDDDVDDGNRNYKVHFGPTSSSDALMNNLKRQSVTLQNIDNDTAGITVMPAGGLVTSEGGAEDTFTAQLSSQPTGNVVIDLSTQSGTAEQVTISPTQLTFTSANWNSPQTVTVTGQDDGGADSTSDTDAVVLTVNAGATQDALYDSLSTVQLSVTNMDDDNAGVVVNPIDDNNLTIGEAHTVDVSLTAPPAAGDVTISFDNPDSTTLSFSHTDFVFTNINYDTAQTLTITAVDSDDIAEAVKNLTIVTSIDAPGDATYDVLTVDDIQVNVTDDDGAGLVLANETNLTTGEDGTSDSFTVALSSSPASGSVTVVVTTSSAGEGNFGGNSSLNLTFTAANWSDPQTVTIDGVNDSGSPERDGTIDYTLTINPGGSAEYDSLSNTTLDVSNLDDERFIFTSTSNIAGDFGGISGADSICNTDPARSDQTVTYKAMLTGDGTTRRATVNPYDGDGQIDWVLESNTNYMRLPPNEDVRVFTSNADRIFDFSIFSEIENAVNTSGGNVWTGFKEDFTSFDKHCENWTDGTSDYAGNFGIRNQKDKTMLDSSNESCQNLNYLYCVEQP